MTRPFRISPRLRRFAADEQGATMVEFAIVFVMFLVFFFALIDFGRLAYNFVIADKSMQLASRIATVRPPVCTGVPTSNLRGTLTATTPPSFGTSCSTTANLCADPGTVTCTGTMGSTGPTAIEVFNAIRGGLPANATLAHLRFRYEFDDNLGFLGGPYTPIVTVELEPLPEDDIPLNFTFIHPLAGLLGMTGVTGSTVGTAAIPFPRMSVSLPGEDLAHGTNG